MTKTPKPAGEENYKEEIEMLFLLLTLLTMKETELPKWMAVMRTVARWQVILMLGSLSFRGFVTKTTLHIFSHIFKRNLYEYERKYMII